MLLLRRLNVRSARDVLRCLAFARTALGGVVPALDVRAEGGEVKGVVDFPDVGDCYDC